MDMIDWLIFFKVGLLESHRVHEQTRPVIRPNRPRVLVVGGSQILGVNTGGRWSTFNLDDLRAAAASSCGGNSNASITLHSIQEGLSKQIN